MTRFLDARIPVAFATPAQAEAAAQVETALLLEGDGASGRMPSGEAIARFVVPTGTEGHPAGCACCVPRGPVAEALGALFLGRARGSVPFFRRVLVVAGPQGRQAVLAALADDPLVSGRFRLDQDGSVVSPTPSARCI